MRVFVCEPAGTAVPPVFQGATGTIEKPYENPQRLTRIVEGLAGQAPVTAVVQEASDAELTAVHDPGMIGFLREMATTEPSIRPLFPDSFPEAPSRPPDALRGRFGFYCTDTQTPFADHYWIDALRSARCSLDAARALAAGDPMVYSVCRPPGHHAGPGFFGGFCYLNNTALAADHLSKHGRVAVFDVDFHHGNGTQECFYRTNSVLTVSIHADTRQSYPFFSGHVDETGDREGKGYNLNLPLGLDSHRDQWFQAFGAGLAAIRTFGPDYVILAFGADTYREDPVGGLGLSVPDYRQIGSGIAGLGLPTLVVQEGGYHLESLAEIVSALVHGLTG